MCDYSLHVVPNRLAREGERLVVARFQSGSIGLAAAIQPADSDAEAPQRSILEIEFWKNLFRSLTHPSTPQCAVCVPPGARLRLMGIPKRIQLEANIGPEEEAVFTELSAQENTYRDAVRFSNGATLLLQRLEPGQFVDVLSLLGEEEETAIPSWRIERIAA